jgi:hypothetical protein
MALISLNSQGICAIFLGIMHMDELLAAVGVRIHQLLPSTPLLIQPLTTATLDCVPLLPPIRWLELLIEPW